MKILSNGRLVTGSTDRTAKLWDVTTPVLTTPLVVFVGHSDKITAIEEAPETKFVVTASSDKSIRVWEQRNGTRIKLISNAHEDAVVVLTVDYSRNYLASGGGHSRRSRSGR